MRTILTFAILLMLGAGCAERVPVPPLDDTPESNPENCVKSGGSIVADVCACPEGFSADPADFCLKAEGVSGIKNSPQ